MFWFASESDPLLELVEEDDEELADPADEDVPALQVVGKSVVPTDAM